MKLLQFLLTAVLIAHLDIPANASGRAGSHVAAVPPHTQSTEAGELFQVAIKLYRQGKLDEALNLCAKASAASPDDYRPHVLAGFCYKSQSKYRSASEAFARAIALEPRDKTVYLMKAAVDGGRRATVEAERLCRKALEIDPEYAEAYAMLGEVLSLDRNRQGQAITAFRAAIRINPGFLSVYQPLGELLFRAGNNKSAEEVYRQGLAADPKHMVCRFALGEMLVKQGRLEEARELWNGRRTDQDEIYRSFIVVLERAENLKRATDALALKPNDPDALVTMGNAVMDGDPWVFDKRQERALVYFRKALKVKPRNAKAQYGICKAYIDLAHVSPKFEKAADQELAILRKLDPALAAELKEYRNRPGGVIGGVPVDLDR
jgi:tetratricopeptide (TPR) repeat protein